jgi:predicted Rdx family selenoprotein
LDAPITQATGSNNTIVGVYQDRIELKSGWQSQNIESVGLRDIAAIAIKGFVNVTLTIQTNTGRVYQLNRMALPDARKVKNAVEQQKLKAGLYE